MSNIYDTLYNQPVIFESNNKPTDIGIEARNVLKDKFLRINKQKIYVTTKSSTEPSMIFSLLDTPEESLELYRELRTRKSNLLVYNLKRYYMPRRMDAKVGNKLIIRNFTKEYTKTLKLKSEYRIDSLVNLHKMIKPAQSCVYDLSYYNMVIKEKTINSNLTMMKKLRTSILELYKSEVTTQAEFTNRVIYAKAPFLAGTRIKLNITEANMLNIFRPILFFLEWFVKNPEEFKAWLVKHQLTFVFEGAKKELFILSGRNGFTNIAMFKPIYIIRMLHLLDGKNEKEVIDLIKEEANPEEIMDLASVPVLNDDDVYDNPNVIINDDMDPVEDIDPEPVPSIKVDDIKPNDDIIIDKDTSKKELNASVQKMNEDRDDLIDAKIDSNQKRLDELLKRKGKKELETGEIVIDEDRVKELEPIINPEEEITQLNEETSKLTNQKNSINNDKKLVPKSNKEDKAKGAWSDILDVDPLSGLKLVASNIMTNDNEVFRQINIDRNVAISDDLADIQMQEADTSIDFKSKDYFSVIDSANLTPEEKAVEIVEMHNYSTLKKSVETPEIKKFRQNLVKKYGRDIEEMVQDMKTNKLEIQEFPTIPEESSYKTSKITKLDTAYKTKIYEKEQENILLHPMKLTYPIFLDKYEKTDISDRTFKGKKLTAKYKMHNGSEFEFSLDVPETDDTGNFFIGGSYKHIPYQNLLKPVAKTDEDVIITSDYKKCIITLRGKYPNMRVKQAVMTLKAFNKEIPIMKVKTTDALGTFIYNNQVSYNLIHLNRSFNGMITNTMNLDFRGIGIESDGWTLLGELNNNKVKHMPEKDLIMWNDVEYDSIDFILMAARMQSPEEFDKCIVRRVTASGINIPHAKIMGKDIPVILVLLVAMPLKELLDKMKEENNLEYKTVKNTEEINKFSNNEQFGIIRLSDYSIILKYNNSLNEMLFTELTTMDLTGYSVFDITNIMESFAKNANTELYLENFVEFFIGPETARACKALNIPDDFVGIFIYAVSLMVSHKTSRKSDVSNMRIITPSEIVNRALYDILATELSNNAARMKRGSRPKFNLSKDALIRRLQAIPSVKEHNQLSPFRNIIESTEVTLKGHYGINEPRAFTMDVRSFNPNNLGAETTATAYSGNAGITKHLPTNPTINDITGAYEIVEDSSELAQSSMISFVESYNPYSKNDHINRRMLGGVQVTHAKQIMDPTPRLVSSYVDEAAVYQTPEFCYVAKGKGTIKKINDNFIIINYDDGETDVVRLKNVDKNSDKGYYLKNDFIINPLFNIVGKKIKAGDIIAHNRNFYKYKSDGHIGITASKLAWTLFSDGEGVWEDSCMPFSDLAESLASEVVVRVARVIDLNTEIRDWNLGIGTDVNPNDILFKYKLLTDDDTINELYINTESLSLKEVDAHSKGVIADIRVYYRRSQSGSMSASVKKFIKELDDVQRVKCNMIDLEDVTDQFKRSVLDSRPQELKRDKFSKINGDVIENGQMLIEYTISTLDKLGPGDKIIVDRALKGEPCVILDKSVRPMGSITGRKASLMSSNVGLLARMTSGAALHGMHLAIQLDIASENAKLLDYPVEEGTLLDYFSNETILKTKGK